MGENILVRHISTQNREAHTDKIRKNTHKHATGEQFLSSLRKGKTKAADCYEINVIYLWTLIIEVCRSGSRLDICITRDGHIMY